MKVTIMTRQSTKHVVDSIEYDASPDRPRLTWEVTSGTHSGFGATLDEAMLGLAGDLEHVPQPAEGRAESTATISPHALVHKDLLNQLTEERDAALAKLKELTPPGPGENKGLNAHRLKTNQDEARFAQEWRARNIQERLLERMLNGGYPEDITARDEVVAATVVQWLGSPVGRGFLADLGYHKE